MRSGLAFKDPPDLNLATGSNVTLRLVAKRTLFDLAGRRVWGDSYNGSFVGPTMHFAPGERVTLKLVNRLSVMSNLHFHGMFISPSGASDNPFIQVAPGHSFTYHLSIPATHPQGTFWYHDHGMVMSGPMMSMPGMSMPGMTPTATTGATVESQIFAGLSGTIVVGDDRSLLPSDLRHIATHTLVFKDVQIDPAGRIVQDTATTSINSNNPTVRLVNGQLRPILTMPPGETQLWRLANEGADIFYRLHLDGYRFTLIAQDGVPVHQITTPDTLLMPPGRRYDVLVTARAHPAPTWLRTLAYSNGPQGDSYSAAQLLQLRVAGSPQSPVPMPTGAMPTAPASLANAPIAQYRTVRLSENSAGTSLYINGKQFNPTRSIFSTPGIVNTVEQWTVLNTSGEVHPFHIHTSYFQVISIDGVPQPYVGQLDTIPVPYKQHGVPGRIVLRIKLADFTGKWMFHCHIAAHEDNGMMSYLNVIAPGGAGSAAAVRRR
jgi:suppressor of ftsI